MEKVKEYNHEINILKALGIIFVVAGHLNISVLTSFFPVYSFHMALFFFISGYLFKEKEISDYLGFVKKKFESLIIPYYCYNLFYAVVTVVVFKLTSKLYGHLPTLYNFFVTPFVDGHQYLLSLSLWFVTTLFLTLCIFYLLFAMLKKIWDNKFFHLAVFLILGFLPCILNHHSELAHGIGLVFGKICFGMCFVYFGYFYKKYLEGKIMFNIKWLCGCLFLQSILWILDRHDLMYFLSFLYFKNAFIPVLTSFTGIYATLFLAKFLTPFIKKDSLFDKIGKSTYSIMANHLFVIFLITCVIFLLTGTDFEKLNTNVFKFAYKGETFKYLYFVITIFVCLNFAEFQRYLKLKFFTKKQTPN